MEQASHIATITKLPSGKYRAQIWRNWVYRAQTFLRKLDAQAWSSQLERAIESWQFRRRYSTALSDDFADVIDAYLHQVRVLKAGG